MFDDPSTSGHFEIGDSHHTTIDVNPTHVDSQGIVCGHGQITTHPSTILSGLTISGNIDGCVVPSHGPSGGIFTGPGGYGNPSTSLSVGFGW